jgi:putative SOS response-associated peptidase YedK
MCGRYVSVSSPTILAERFAVETVRVTEKEPDYNVTPRADVPVVAVSRGERTLDLVRWGLVPSWAKDLSIGDKLINARADTVATKPAYKRAFVKRRCIIPADGFYEWQKLDAKEKQAFAIEPIDSPMFAFAGLWDRWRDPETREIVRSCTIITTGANELMAPIHNRMPVILDEKDWSQWLGQADVVPEELQAMLKPFPAERMRAYKISPHVNSVKNDDAAVLAAI